ncbi:MAG: hypothetical protein V2I76_10125 [Roseobacter sp.]|jgi:hypothetical protein|nr:hypothetical protein [Roseobacter sp.]
MAQARTASRTVFGVPVPVALFFIAMMLPTAVSLNLGGLRLSAYRVVLLVMILPMLMDLVTSKRGRAHVFDFLVLAHCGWVLLALINWGGLAQGIESGGIYVVEFAGAYLMGRLYVRSFADFAAIARAYVGLVLAMLVFTVPEALTGIHILHDGISGAVGGPMAPYIEPRMGIERTFGPFDHPILYGVFSASSFSLAYFVIAKRRLMNLSGMGKVVGVVLATFMSASGGPYLVLMMQGFVCAWERVLATVQGRWAALFTLFALAYIAIDLFSTKSPFHVFVNNFTFSKQSAYNRILIFEFGSAEVARHPFFGIGLGDWERPVWMSDSMDNFWLVTAVRYGLPALFLLLALLLGLVWAVGQRKNLPAEWRRARHAWAFTLFGITVAAATVHLWNALFVLFLFLIGAGAWLLDAKPENAKRGIVCSGRQLILRPAARLF